MAKQITNKDIGKMLKTTFQKTTEVKHLEVKKCVVGEDIVVVTLTDGTVVDITFTVTVPEEA